MDEAPRVFARIAAGLAAASAFGVAGCAVEPPAPPRPNLLLINLDDARADGLDRMPTLQQRLVARGIRFTNAFTPSAACTPSRASLLTGLHAVNHGTRSVYGPLGGAPRFRADGADQRTLAVWLQAAGYRTGLFGKYLNSYSRDTEGRLGPGETFYVPPGWDRWWAFHSPAHYGGVHGPDYSVVEEDGRLTRLDDHESDVQYSTDLSAEKLREFVRGAARDGVPFFAYWAPYAPHVDVDASTGPGQLVPIPAARHRGRFAGVEVALPPAAGEGARSGKPRWVRKVRKVPASHEELQVRRSYETLLAVDEQIEATLALLAELGLYEDTAIVLTSDNGSLRGEHGIPATRKACPYEPCQRVPLIVSWPRRASGPEVETLPVLNLDLAPTLAELAGATVPVPVDGASFASLLRGEAPPEHWRRDYLIEFWRPVRDDALFFEGGVADGDRVRLLQGPPRATPRPSTLFEFDAGGGVGPGAVAVPLRPDGDAARALARAVRAHVPEVEALALELESSSPAVVARDRSPAHHGVLWWEERDAGDAIRSRDDVPDYLGVRDVARGYTWVEYESGERELYDLNADPQQLANRADDPAYAEVRRALEARLVELLDEVAPRRLAPDAGRSGDVDRRPHRALP